MKKNRIVGITIGTKSNKYKDKVYYYKTNEELKEGDSLEVKMPTGGVTDCKVVDNDNKSKHKLPIKDMEIVRK